jgi:hypothetical protein
MLVAFLSVTGMGGYSMQWVLSWGFIFVQFFLLPSSAKADSLIPIYMLSFGTTTPVPGALITSDRTRALEIFTAVTGTKIGIDDVRLMQMEALIAKGKDKEAAAIATADRAFYNIRIANMARKMSNRDETVQAPLSDFVATFVGAVRDDMDARSLLTGNFYYRFDSDKMTAAGIKGAPPIDINTIRTSNNHYANSANFSMYDALIRIDGQPMDATGSPLPDAAGLITTRSFMAAHAIAGTNRRLVEYSFREFMCVTMQDWKDATRPDDYVGRDVDRFAGGGDTKYQSTCKGCHAQMDGFRQAFAYVNFDGSAISYTPMAVQPKFASNNTVFPAGWITIDDSFANHANGPTNSDKFGWRTPASGKGMNDFGKGLANSKGFSRCMVKRVFTELCKRPPTSDEDPIVRDIADQFETSYNYKIKSLAEAVAVHPSCLPKGG